MRDQETPRLRKFARKMRSSQTDAEAVLWDCLRARRLHELKFKRQVPVSGYIVDFLCTDRKLIIEVDGTQHAENSYDERRDQKLKQDGYTVLRFWNDDVLRDLNNVCDHIIALADIGS